MGIQASKRQDLPQSRKTYPNTFRSYAKWEYHSGLISHDTLRVTAYEINNLLKTKSRIDQNQPIEELSTSKNVITIQELIRNQLQTKHIPSNLQLALINQNDLQVKIFQSKKNFSIR